MKPLLIILLFLLNFHFIEAQTFDIETIKFSGNDEKRINLVILSEGYQTHELDQFVIDATSFTNDLFSQSPFLEYTNYFNVYAIKVPSAESGADHPGNGSGEPSPPVPVSDVDTYFNATYDGFGFHRLLYAQDYAAINTVLANNFPTYDQALLLANSPYYGGSGGEFPISSTGTSANEISIHEIGHSFADLKDEYYPGDVLAAEAINMTQETDPALVKWKNWLGTDGIGIYQYCGSGSCASWYRPHQNCKMQFLGVPFCAVCKEGIIEKIHSLVSPIDSFTPISTLIDNPAFPLEFQLNLIPPTPNTLERTWTLNSMALASNVDQVNLLDTDLNTGTNTLVARVNDDSDLLRIDNHETLHVYTVSWTINKNTLGVNGISSETNDFNISIYPNPSHSTITIKYESTHPTSLKAEMTSLDGKKLKSVTLSQENNIDISGFSQGVYLIHFYNNAVLLATKKIVKN